MFDTPAPSHKVRKRGTARASVLRRERECYIAVKEGRKEAAAAPSETETVCSLGFLMGLLGESAERNGNRQKGGEDRKGREREREYLPQIEEISLPPTYRPMRLQSFSD